MNCNVIIGASFLGSGVKSYTPVFIVCWHVIALLLSFLWISERTRIQAVGPVRVFLFVIDAPGVLYNAVLGVLLFVGVICRLACFQPVISPLHSNSGYDLPVGTARILIGLFAPYWLIIPAIAVQRAYNWLKTNKTVFK